MRIVAGEFGGRHLAAPIDKDIRPTTDRVRESLFAIITSRYPDLLKDARVIDLFAGTGAFGLEAISRGAQFSLFVENSAEGYALVGKNINNLNLESRTKIFRRDATGLGSIGKMEPFDLVFADPPYGKGLAEKAVVCLVKGGWLNPDAIVIIEDKAGSSPPLLPSCKLLDERRFGETKICFLKPDL